MQRQADTGFNLDHGTDLATSVDGIPVNLHTHGHGRGYTDMKFVIPELLDRFEYKKGTYFADEGNCRFDRPRRAASRWMVRRRTLSALRLGTARRRRQRAFRYDYRGEPRNRAALAVYNVFDSNDNDITYFYESQLPGEAGPVEDRHFHPVEPRTFRLTMETRF